MKEAVVLLMACCAAFPAAASIEPPFTLICEFVNGETRTSKNFVVDELKETIDEQPAKFSENMIIFDRTDEQESTSHYEINRLTGDINTSCGTPCKIYGKPATPTGPGPTGTCQKASQTKRF